METKINILEELDSLSQMHALKRDDIDAIMQEFAKRLIALLRIERVSVWLFNESKGALTSIGEYDLRVREFKKGTVLLQEDYPNYFANLEYNKIILATDIHAHLATFEFSENYAKVNGICTLMDIPLRMCGELIGVMCFEKTGKQQKVFNENEQAFALCVSQVLASTLEARQRRAAQSKLESAIKEKELLIKEINHRLKNNFSILISLVRLSKDSGKTKDFRVLLEEYEQRIFSMLKLHDLLNTTKNYTEVGINAYLKELCKEFREAYKELENKIELTFSEKDVVVGTKTAINFGLIVTEIFLNAIKHSLTNSEEVKFIVSTERIDNYFLIRIGDSGNGFDFDKLVNQSSLGLSIIKDLSESSELKVIYPNNTSSLYVFEIVS